ncbi:ABC transporter permease [Nonomuraea dietziae]|uniref:Transmembrane transport protein n=1 Tax=Nonomuraea dietziae TaxID=65515 RepID=A0A7W5VCN6_9ACTN|nr:ABC transporter permease [Nonomuraea dietziae]MBB3732416.1 hypothetical protein [Nonomuraea dietziae]
MLWLTWRQHRMQLLVTVALLAVLGALLLVNGLGAAGFDARNPPPADCASDYRAACAGYTAGMMEWMWAVGDVVGWLPLLAPAMIGAFWGAPLLAREFEHGTDQLTWTQSVTRRRWLIAKVGGLGAAVTLGGLALGAIVGAWLAVFDSSAFPVNFFNTNWFRLVGIGPAAWWLSAFVLGVAAGALIRRTLPAMAVTLAVCALAFFGLLSAPRLYATPERFVQTTAAGSDLVPDTAMVVESYWTDRNGMKRTSDDRQLALAVPCGIDETTKAYAACSFDHGYRQVQLFHPASRFWRFQWMEAGILLLPAFALGGVAVRRTLRPRI